MPKRASSFELSMRPRDAETPAYRWLYSSLRTDILEGRLRPGARLPATRDLARQYGLSRGTVVNGFEQLKAEGYLAGSVGSGTYVSKVLPEELLHVPMRDGAQKEKQRTLPRRVSDYAQRARLFRGYEARPPRAFRCNLPALDLFPLNLWTKITTRCLRRVARRDLLGCDPLGHRPLRQAVAEYLGTSRGVKCVPEQVAIVSGVQEALDLVSRLLLNPGDRICMETPGYPGAALAFHAFGAHVSVAGMDEEGIKIGELPRRGVRLLYVTPGHQFPLGTTMSLARRLQLLEWARAADAMIFEDDYDGEYRYSGRPVPALQALDRSGSVLYAGSFSKVLFPSLRLGFLVIPTDLVGRCEAIKSLTCRHAPLLEQLVLTEFIAEGHFGRHLRHMRTVYAERLAVLLDEAKLKLAGLLQISEVGAGLQTTGWLWAGCDGDAAAAAAAKRDVDVTPVKRYGDRARREGLHLGFAAIEKREIRRGVRELAIALEGMQRGARATPIR